MMDIKEALGYVSQLFMNLTGFIDIGWEFDGDDVIIFNKDFEGSPADDNWEAATLIGNLTGWEPYEITKDEEYNQYGKEPYYVGLRRK